MDMRRCWFGCWSTIQSVYSQWPHPWQWISATSANYIDRIYCVCALCVVCECAHMYGMMPWWRFCATTQLSVVYSTSSIVRAEWELKVYSSSCCCLFHWILCECGRCWSYYLVLSHNTKRMLSLSILCHHIHTKRIRTNPSLALPGSWLRVSGLLVRKTHIQICEYKRRDRRIDRHMFGTFCCCCCCCQIVLDRNRQSSDVEKTTDFFLLKYFTLEERERGSLSSARPMSAAFDPK